MQKHITSFLSQYENPGGVVSIKALHPLFQVYMGLSVPYRAFKHLIEEMCQIGEVEGTTVIIGYSLPGSHWEFRKNKRLVFVS